MEEAVKPRILVITERYSPENFLVNDLVSAWVRRGYSVSVLTQVPSYPADKPFDGYPNRHSLLRENGVRVRRFKTVFGYKKSLARKILNYASFMLRACWFSLCELPRHDIVFVYHTGPLTQALPLLLAKDIFNKRTLIWTQDVWPDTVFAYGFPNRGAFALLLKSFVRLIYRACDKVCVSSEGFIRRLRPYMPKGREALFVPQWVPEGFLNADPSPLNLKLKAKSFIFTGNIGSMQNLELVVRAFSRFSEDEAVLYLLGDGSRRAALEELAESLACRNIRFLGSLPVAQVLNTVRQCDFALLSLRDDPVINLTVPAKFQSYLAAGRPILALCQGEVRSLVDSYGLGESADPGDIDGIVEAVRRCINLSDEDYGSCVAAMERLLVQKYDKEAILRVFDKALCASEPDISSSVGLLC